MITKPDQDEGVDLIRGAPHPVAMQRLPVPVPVFANRMLGGVLTDQ